MVIASEVPLQTGSFDVHVQHILAGAPPPHPDPFAQGWGEGTEEEEGGDTFKLTRSPAASVLSERRLQTLFFPRLYHPKGCKGSCPFRNAKSNPESRHLPWKGEGGGELLSILTWPFPAAAGFFYLGISEFSEPKGGGGVGWGRGERQAWTGRGWHAARALPKPQESRAPGAGNSRPASRGGGPARRPAPPLPVEEP